MSLPARKFAWTLAIASSIGIHLAAGLLLTYRIETIPESPQGTGRVVLRLADVSVSTNGGADEPTPTPTPVVQTSKADSDQSVSSAISGQVAAASSGNPTEQGGDPDAKYRYEQELLTWLQRYKKYPRRLKRQGVEGEVVIHFTLDAEGRLLHNEVVTSSGVTELDDAAIALLDSAQPMPPIPSTMGLETYSTKVPIRYAVDR